MAKRRSYKNLNYRNIFISVLVALVVIFLVVSGLRMLVGNVMALFSPEEKKTEIPEVTTEETDKEPEKQPVEIPSPPADEEETKATTTSESASAVTPEEEETPEETTPVEEERPVEETPKETTIYGVVIGGNLEANMEILKQQGKDSKVLKRYVYEPQSGVVDAIDGDVVTLVVDVMLTKEKVKWLQEQLKIAGYYTTRDGGFGNNTKATLAKYTEAVMGEKIDTFTSDVEASLESNNKGKLAGDIDRFEILVNKNYNVLAESIPSNLVTPSVLHSSNVEKIKKEVDDQLIKMFTAAQKDGVGLKLISGYRDYDYASKVFDDYVAKDGYENAVKYSALPGQSEHQTGLAVDLDDVSEKYTLDENFDTTKAFQWLDEHAAEYGFILRYPKDKEQFTNYSYEPWHYRYVGSVELAKYIKKNNLSFEEYKLTQGL